MAKRKILLIAFKYPPYSQVGAFRWTQLSKYLAQLGHEVHVVTVDWKLDDIHGFLTKIDVPGIIIHRIPSGYPHNLKYRNVNNPFLRIIKNRFFIYFLDRYIFEDDEAQDWGKYLLPFCKTVIADQVIKIVIATGSPFQSNLWAAKLKEEMPEIRLIQDLRDPWVRNPFKYYRNMKKALAVESHALSQADSIVTVTEGLKEHYCEITDCNRITVITNGFDPEQTSNIDKASKSSKSIEIVYTGSLTNGRNEILEAALKHCKENKIDNLKWIIVGKVPSYLLQNFKELIEKGVLVTKDWTPQVEAFKLIANADFALQLNSRYYPYALSTKIFESSALGTPCISLNYGGDIHRLIMRHSLGYSVNLKQQQLEGFIDKLAAGTLKKSFTFAVDQFSYPNIALQYSSLIQSL